MSMDAHFNAIKNHFLLFFLFATLLGGCDGTASVSVSAAVITAIQVTPEVLSVAKGQTQQLTAQATYSDGTSADVSSSVAWLSSNTALATVTTGGLLTGVEAGALTVTASKDGVTSNTASVSVSAAVITALTITPEPMIVAQGRSAQMFLTATYSDGSQAVQNSGITWASSNTAIMTVNTTGVTSGISLGAATLSARKGSLQTSIQVNVEQGPAIVSVGPGLSVGSAGLNCLIDGNTSNAYDPTCVTYTLTDTDFGWIPGITQITLATTFSEPLKSIRFTGYWRQGYNPLDSGGKLGSWTVFGCDDASCMSATELGTSTYLSFNSVKSLITFPGNTRAFPFYRLVFQNGPVDRNFGSGTGNFSEVIYGF